jgi:hypothetical protein
MRPYWVTFSDLKDFSGLGLGVGVTGHDIDDALMVVREAFGPLTISKIVAVDDVASLDEGHVRPNMGSIFLRGIWFPLGHQQVRTPQVR